VIREMALEGSGFVQASLIPLALRRIPCTNEGPLERLRLSRSGTAVKDEAC
jgi:hypothetical protein